MKIEELKSKIRPDIDTDLLLRHLDLVMEANKVTNLTAIEDRDEAIVKHIYDCLIPLNHIDIKGKKVLDIGSGAGFPGIVFAIAEPTATLVLCESNGKKSAFLRSVIETLGLKNATVVTKRAEELRDIEAFDVVTARAVGDLRKLMEICSQLIKVKGAFLALRGSKWKEETQEAAKAAKILHLELKEEFTEQLPDGYGERYLGIYQKTKKTPRGYPRPYREISATPL